MGLRLLLGRASDYVARREFRTLVRRAADLMYSDMAGIVIRKDLTGDRGGAERKRQPPIRHGSLEDVLSLVGADPEGEVDADELWQRRLRRHIATTIGVEGCFVADDPVIGPAFMQYLFMADDNQRLRAAFPGLFPVLGADDAMVEFLYVAPRSRNPGLAVNCLIQVADEARSRGATSVISFINPTNKGALFVNHLAGFRADSVRRSRRRFFRRSYTFAPWPADTSQRLNELAIGGARIS